MKPTRLEMVLEIEERCVSSSSLCWAEFGCRCIKEEDEMRGERVLRVVKNRLELESHSIRVFLWRHG